MVLHPIAVLISLSYRMATLEIPIMLLSSSILFSLATVLHRLASWDSKTFPARPPNPHNMSGYDSRQLTKLHESTQ